MNRTFTPTAARTLVGIPGTLALVVAGTLLAGLALAIVIAAGLASPTTPADQGSRNVTDGWRYSIVTQRAAAAEPVTDGWLHSIVTYRPSVESDLGPGR